MCPWSVTCGLGLCHVTVVESEATQSVCISELYLQALVPRQDSPQFIQPWDLGAGVVAKAVRWACGASIPPTAAGFLAPNG